MRKWIFWLGILVILGYGATQYNDKISQENERTIQITKDQIYKGNLLLVNKEHPVPPDGEASEAINLSKHGEQVNGFVLLDKTIRLTPNLLQKFSKMIEAANKDGVNHFMISSGYRDGKEQNELYEEMGSDYALPAGYSEHNLGLSLDIGSTQGEIKHTAEGKWLESNNWKYGFILRYPEDKADITGNSRYHDAEYGRLRSDAVHPGKPPFAHHFLKRQSERPR